MDLNKLKEPFAPSDVSWRIGQVGKNREGKIWAKVLAYIDNRNIQDRLDEVVGPENWRNEYTVGPAGGVLCGLSIRINNEWVTKWDGAENSDIEAVKGGLSDSMKRAAVQWGIGRYLYDLGENWADVFSDRREGSHYANCKIKVEGKEDWASFHWLPPRLPAFAVPTIPPEDVAKVNQVAAKAGMTTADKLPTSSDTYKRAMNCLEKAVRERDVNAVAAILNGGEKRKAEGKLSDNEHKSLMNECTLALRKIKELEREPVGAGA